MKGKQIRISPASGVLKALEKAAAKVGKKPSTLAREFMEQRMNQLDLIDYLTDN